MITGGLLGFIATVINFIISIRPDWQPTLPDSAYTAMSYIKGLDSILPVTELSICVGFLLTGLVAMFSFKYVVKLIDWITSSL